MNRPLVVVTIIALVALVIVMVVLPLYQVDWSGFGEFRDPVTGELERVKTLWAWMELLIVPVILAIAAYYLNDQVRRRSRRQEDERILEDALRAYFDAMTALLLLREDGVALAEAARTVATLRTVTVLRRLDARRIQEVIDFLRDSDLLNGESAILTDARLTNVTLSGLDMQRSKLKGVDFSESKLAGADLSASDLRETDFTLADLSGANLNEASLDQADMSGTRLEGAYLVGAVLKGANLEGAVFSGETVLPDGSKWTRGRDLSEFTG